MPKYLLIRFSAIGDIVLTSPVIRSLKQARPDAEVHFLTKAGMAPILAHNPYIDQLHLLGKDENLWSLAGRLRPEGYDALLDLHGSLRSRTLSLLLQRPRYGFDKANEQKKRLVRQQPAGSVSHIVTRYGQVLEPLGIRLDDGGLDFFLPAANVSAAESALREANFDPAPALAVALGATHATKRWPVAYFAQTLNQLGRPCLLLGGKDALNEAAYLRQHLRVPFFDAVGRFDLLTAAALLRSCHDLLTHDTGFMHIGAAFGMKIYSLWGSTVPEFGMTPYKTSFVALETKGLDCRPCSRIGFDTCPRGHFRCMKDLDPGQVLDVLSSKS